jgi:hypothetical protein
MFDPPVFVVAIEEGRARVEKGVPSQAFLNDCGEIARSFGIQSGFIYGCRGGGLRFSSDIPDESHQRFRNVLGFHGGRMKR